jgi:hypothetical protein
VCEPVQGARTRPRIRGSADGAVSMASSGVTRIGQVGLSARIKLPGAGVIRRCRGRADSACRERYLPTMAIRHRAGAWGAPERNRSPSGRVRTGPRIITSIRVIERLPLPPPLAGEGWGGGSRGASVPLQLPPPCPPGPRRRAGEGSKTESIVGRRVLSRAAGPHRYGLALQLAARGNCPPGFPVPRLIFGKCVA